MVERIGHHLMVRDASYGTIPILFNKIFKMSEKDANGMKVFL